jgi:hypothetical protein
MVVRGVIWGREKLKKSKKERRGRVRGLTSRSQENL